MRKTDIVSSRLIGCQVRLTTPWVWAISCGDTLGPGGTFTLEADLVCPEPTEAPALTLIDGATLDLHGFSLRLYNAVALLGSGTTIRNGTIANCNGATITACGVGAGGSGGHLMERLSITSGNQAIGLGSDGNVVQDCRLAADQGVIIAGNHNLIQRVEARGAFPAFLVSGDHNALTRNVSTGGQHGYSVTGNSNALLGNTANGDGLAGISVEGDNNLILENHVASFSTGISVQNGAVNNRLIGNRATTVVDSNGTCTANTWLLNSYTNSDPACLLQFPHRIVPE